MTKDKKMCVLKLKETENNQSLIITQETETKKGIDDVCREKKETSGTARLFALTPAAAASCRLSHDE